MALNRFMNTVVTGKGCRRAGRAGRAGFITAVLLAVLASYVIPFGGGHPEPVRQGDDEMLWRGGGGGTLSFEPFQDSLNVRRVGRALFEPLGTFCVERDTCYIISGRELLIYEVGDPSSPVFVSSHRIEVVNVRDVSSVGSSVYLTAYQDGFWILDKANGYRVSGSYHPDRTLRSFISGGRAYLSCSDGLHIVDISNPDDPILLGVYAREGGLAMVSVDGTVCTATCSEGLVTLDVSDPGGIVELDTLEMGISSNVLAVRDTLAYVTKYSAVPTYLAVVDVSDPLDLRELGRMDLDYDIEYTFAPLYVHGHYVMLTCDNISHNGGGLHIIDAENPASMEEVGYYPVESPLDAGISFPLGFAVNGEGLRAVDFTDLQQPEEVGFIDGDHYVADIYTHEGFSYIADGSNGFSTLDIRNPQQPQIVSVDTSASVNDVMIDGSYAYLACGTSQLRILDITDPLNPEEVGVVDAGNAVSVDVVMPYACVAGGDGLHIIDVGNLDSLTEVGSLTLGFLKEIVVSGHYAYLACGFDGMRVVDISDPEAPREASRVNALDWTTGVGVSGHYAYMADGYGGVRVIDVQDPGNPVPVAQSLAGYGNRLYITEPYLFLAGGSYGLKVLDISMPDSIHEVGSYPIASLGGIFSDEDYIYYGTIDNGFYIFEFTPTGIREGEPGGSGRIPRDFVLHQNYPNPFNPETTITFDVPEGEGALAKVDLAIYDSRGRLVRTLVSSASSTGRHRVVWDGRNDRGEEVASGTYFSVLTVGNRRSACKMIVLQ